MRDLNDLNFFAAVVANGGFSAAARALGSPKSRISRRLAALEAQLGVRLIERSTRRFKVTEVGQDVYQHARAALTEAEAIEDVVMRLKAELGLQRRHAAADARLGRAEGPGRRREAPVRHHGREEVEIVQIAHRLSFSIRNTASQHGGLIGLSSSW